MIQFESEKLQNNLGLTTGKKQQEPQEKNARIFNPSEICNLKKLSTTQCVCNCFSEIAVIQSKEFFYKNESQFINQLTLSSV